MLDQPRTPPQDSCELLVGGSDRHKWIVYESGRNKFEEREPEQPLHSSRQKREQGSGWRHGKGDPRNRRFDNPIDGRRSSSYKELRYAEPEADCKIMHEDYSDITQKVKADVPAYDGRLDANTFSDCLITIEDYFDWYRMSDIECVRFTKMKLVGPTRKVLQKVTTHLERMHQPPITQWAVMKDRLKEKYLPSFHRAHLVD